MDRHAALKVGQGKIDATVTDLGGAQYREQSLVLIDGQ